jgi:release factor glutamine methyltransferase
MTAIPNTDAAAEASVKGRATLRERLQQDAQRLAGVAEQPRFEADLLWAHVLGLSRAQLLMRDREVPPADAAAAAAALVERRCNGEPVAYLLGRREFWSLNLKVTPAVLIPRPETELLVEWALENIPQDREVRVADLGTGSGAIALAIAAGRARARVVATDRSVDALAVARANAESNDVHNVEFRQGDWWAALAGERFDLIVSNPPYIAENDAHLPALRYEPRLALTSGQEGLDAIRILVAGAQLYLNPGGALGIEHGAEQGAAVRDLFAAADFAAIETRRDYAGHERVTGGRLP